MDIILNNFENFKEKFVGWSFAVEEKQSNNLPVCPYAKHARVTNNLQFFDGRENLKECFLNYTGETDMGVVWLGDNIDSKTVNSTLKEQRKIKPNIVYFLSTANSGYISKSFTNTIIMHRYDDYLIKQRSLYEQGYYEMYPSDAWIKIEIDNTYKDLYPIRKQKTQVIGSESQYRIFDYYFDSPGSVLDIGGNAGNLLSSNNKKIVEYSCLDISDKIMYLGKQMYPGANFYFYDRYNEYYNINGNTNEPFPEIKKHDYVFINSVFTSSSFEDMIYILEQSLNIANKKIVFSVFDYNNTSLKEKFNIDILTKESEVSYTAKSIKFHNIDLLKEYIKNKFSIDVSVDTPCPIDNNFTVFCIER
jgi:hypothetical protein